MVIKNMQHIDIHIDGSCLGNSRTAITPGGAGIVIPVPDGNPRTWSAYFPNTTSDRAELTALLMAMKIADREYKESKIIIHTDSRYVVDGVTAWLQDWIQNGWKRRNGKAVQNSDLWKEIAELPRLSELTLTWERGHAGNKMNELADKLATSAAKSGTTTPVSA